RCSRRPSQSAPKRLKVASQRQKRHRPKLLQLLKSTSSSSPMPAPKPTGSAKKHALKAPRSSRTSRPRLLPSLPASPSRHTLPLSPSVRQLLSRFAQRLALWLPRWLAASLVKHSLMMSVPHALWTASWQIWRPRTQVQQSIGREIERIADHGAGGVGSKASFCLAAVGKGPLRNPGNGGQLGWLAPRPD